MKGRGKITLPIVGIKLPTATEFRMRGPFQKLFVSSPVLASTIVMQVSSQLLGIVHVIILSPIASMAW